ncbi:MAG TPA: radical SAM protein, partial [bacterium]|nr:radical SAM protein [bacterium]
DAFMARPVEDLRRFAQRMKEEVGLPFVVTGVTPTNLTDEKLEILLNGGLQWIRLGIQTTSERVNRNVYNRPTSFEAIKRAVEIIRKYHHRMDRVWYDFIIDNPWETQEETLETLRFMLTLPRPFALCVYSLTYFPKTRIAERALQEGILNDPNSQVYRKSYKNYQRTYINNLFLFFTLSRLPRWVLGLFVNRWILRLGLHHPLTACHTVLRKAKSRFLQWKYRNR